MATTFNTLSVPQSQAGDPIQESFELKQNGGNHLHQIIYDTNNIHLIDQQQCLTPLIDSDIDPPDFLDFGNVKSTIEN